MKTCENGCCRPALSTWGSAGVTEIQSRILSYRRSTYNKNSGTETSIVYSSKLEVPASNRIGTKRSSNPVMVAATHPYILEVACPNEA